MKTSEYIAFTIGRLPKGYVFTYADFITEVNQREAIIKALNRMVASGKIAKLPVTLPAIAYTTNWA